MRGRDMTDQSKAAVRLWAAALLLTIGLFSISKAYVGFDQVLFGDNDDAMRMVTVKDFLAGQQWFDHMQYRMNTPYGAEMHWSRLVDLPIALLMLLIQPFAGASSEVLVGYAWPAILVAIFIWLNGQLTLRLVGRDGLLPGMVIAAFSVITFGEFDFGRIDHHSVQIILTQIAVLFSIDALSKPNAALWAGLAVATSLAIGTEALPVVVAAILIYGMIYVVSPALHPIVRRFGAAFGLGTVGHLMLALPPDLWFSPACDAISIVYATAAAGTGLGLFGLTLLPLNGQSWPPRLLAGAIAGAAVLGAVVVLFPECLAGPYAIVDPWLVENWLGRIGEAMPLYEVIATQPIFVVSAGMPALLSLVAAFHAISRSTGAQRANWLVATAMLVVLIAVAFVQLRSIRISAALTAPACAYWVVLARQRYLERASVGRALGLVGSWLGFAGTLWAALVYLVLINLPVQAGQKPIIGANRAVCLAPSAYADLAAMPPLRLLTQLDLGAYTLLYTHHEIVSAPYHRNNQGLLDNHAFFNGPIEEARGIAQARGVTHVVICSELSEMEALPVASDDSFLRLYVEDALPDWLEKVDGDGALTIYAIRPS